MITFNKYFNLILESKQSIINLGYPKIIASLIFDKYGKHSFIISKWLKESTNWRFEQLEHLNDWWRRVNRETFTIPRRLHIVDLVEIYNCKTPEDYYNWCSKNEYPPYNKDMDSYDFQEFRESLVDVISDKLFNNYFFHQSFIENITSGKIKDLSAYDKLSFKDASEKYANKKIFQDTPPIKTYSNGFKWIDVGPRCELIGKLMANCGSAGVMSSDEDKTIIVLFDGHNNPHVITTYSPTEKRLSGDQGKGSTAVKDEYHDYVLDLADILGANFDTEKSKSKLLSLKSQLKGKVKNIERISSSDDYKEIFKITTPTGKTYFTDGYWVSSEHGIPKLKNYNYTEHMLGDGSIVTLSRFITHILK